MAIVYKPYSEIDKQKWDKCIDGSINSLLYAKSFYLDSMAPGWQALVLGDYEAVMPLTSGKKWGTSYLYQSAFVPQAGIFCATNLSGFQVQAFLEMAAGIFKFIEIPLNYSNSVPTNENYNVVHRSNYVLPLNTNYNNIYTAYTDSTKKNLKRVKKFNLEYKVGTSHEKIVSLYQEAYADKMKAYVKDDFERLVLLFDKLAISNNLLIREVYSGNELLAAAVFPFDGRRIYNLVSYVSANGRNKEANYFMFDNVIQEFSEKPLILDFEGSDVDGIASFYRRFTHQNERYPFVKINRLPFPVKQLKLLKDKLSTG